MEMSPMMYSHPKERRPRLPFDVRLQQRRARGDTPEAIARWVTELLDDTTQYALPIDKQKLPLLLNEEEWQFCQRQTAALWAKRQRRDLTAKVKRATQEKACTKQGSSARDQQRAEEANIRKALMAKGAITISEVARRLSVSLQDVRKLHASGELPSAGFVPVQHSYGRPVHLWLPETILRHLNRPKTQ